MAISDFSALLQEDPLNAAARTYRGRAYAKQVRTTGIHAASKYQIRHCFNFCS